jgi:4-hydroxybenzoate polyprenyltransferase
MGLISFARDTVRKIEAAPLSPAHAAGLIASAIFLRTFFENFVNTNNGGTLNGVIDTFFHYPLGFGSVFLATMLILATLGGTTVRTARTVVAYSSFIILLPPTIDFFTSGFAGQLYSFVVGDIPTLAFHFATLFLFTGAFGAGIKIEILVALASIFVYVLHTTGNAMRAAAAAALVFSCIYLFLTIPAWLHHGYRALTDGPQTTTEQFFLVEEPTRSAFWPRPIVTDLRNSGAVVGTTGADHSSITIAAALFVTFVALLAALYRRHTRELWWTVLKNVRYTRIAHYLLLLAFGCMLGLTMHGTAVSSLGDLLAFVLLASGFVFAWLYAVWENDEEDEEIDRISNAERPLVESPFPKSEWTELRWTFFALSLVASFLAGWYPFTFTLTFLLLYHLYSCPPLRLKRVLGLSSAIIALNAFLAVAAGFFLAADTERLDAFPSRIALGIFLMFLLAENVKNLKDIEGDREAGIRTLPVLLGEPWGRRVTAGLAALAVLLVPFFFNGSLLLASIASVAAAAVYALATRKPYRELPVFLVYLVFFVSFFLLTVFGLA